MFVNKGKNINPLQTLTKKEITAACGEEIVDMETNSRRRKVNKTSSTTQTNVTGVMFNYYLVCHTKLWLFAHNIQMEQESDIVALGKLTHEEHYSRDASKDEFTLAGIKLDRITPDGYIHEIKKSDAGMQAHIWQLKYYLWVLKENGFGSLNGVLEFPKQRKRVEVTLTEEDEAEIQTKIAEIQNIVKQPKPPKAVKISFCRRCSYRELCWC